MLQEAWGPYAAAPPGTLVPLASDIGSVDGPPPVPGPTEPPIGPAGARAKLIAGGQPLAVVILLEIEVRGLPSGA
jgi:hypothetical protein